MVLVNEILLSLSRSLVGQLLFVQEMVSEEEQLREETTLALDRIHSSLQPAGQTSSAEVVHHSAGEDEEEDHARVDREHSLSQTEDVQFSRMERLEDRLQTVGRVSSVLGSPPTVDLVMRVFTSVVQSNKTITNC